jgi:hypothetical protein
MKKLLPLLVLLFGFVLSAEEAVRTCPVSGTRQVVAALKKTGAKIKYTEDPKKGPICNTWTDVSSLGDWLFKQRDVSANQSVQPTANAAADL